ncbi:MAG TPA: hypothetical protein VFI09_01125 [Solirubrobacterales bacterium]|nr:hypothetical protein [Solirubrobacterales bacterium]
MVAVNVRGILTTALVVVAAVGATSSAYAAGSSIRPASSKTPSVTLGSGEIEGDSWSASLRREQGAAGEGPRGKERPCIGAVSQGIGGGEGATACVFSQRLTPRWGGLLVTASKLNETGTEAVMTAVAMVFAPHAVYVEATHPGGTVETIRLRRLTRGQAKKSGLKRLRYVAFATVGPWCVARLASFDRTGQRLWRSGNVRRKNCSTES